MRHRPGMKANFFESSIEFHEKMKRYCEERNITLCKLIIDSVNKTIDADKDKENV